MRGNNPPSGIGNLLSGLLRGMDLESKLQEQTCILVWDEVVGEQVSSAAQPEFIKDGRMFVVTKSSTWANELTFYKADMIARLNRRVGASVLKDIIFKSGKIVRRKAEASEDEMQGPGLEGIQLTDRELESVEAAARGAGEEASGVVGDFIATSMRLEKWKLAQGWTPCKKCGALQKAESGICPVCSITP